ncbi:MarR family winged helix-turn-helix transcriptional regulator [Acaricomes phytoseiuli]|uniref:MarR family winged helix-turn-helix transcriptional regulator n=1 Tax=Acaricomes phytoseiuli TaxID=291968 RepID=UPI000372A91D|nr:MarR family winged helix-turn-helix transcriptional regulator [Acaricomes phytoseiuli]MCW1250362.1 MarR family winged helix-turn-helix transcriptional regulator [Acaricomes phytoseiuli]
MTVQDQTLADLVSEVFRLFRTIKQAAHENEVETRGPRLAHIGILSLLSQFGECRASELAERIGVGPSALSRQLAELGEAGLLERRPDPEDGRATLIKLSAAGRRTLSGVQAQRSEWMRHRLRAWDEADAERALRAVGTLADAFQQPTDQPEQSDEPDGHQEWDEHERLQYGQAS